MSDVSQFLGAAAAGDRQAAAELLPLVYAELRGLAAARLARERAGHTLQPTALVHEAYLRLVGDQQFEGRGHCADSAVRTLARVLNELPAAPRAVRRGVPRDLETIALKCLEKRPDRRYGSAAALADDLRRFLDGRTIAARRVGPAERLRRGRSGTRRWPRSRPRCSCSSQPA